VDAIASDVELLGALLREIEPRRGKTALSRAATLLERVGPLGRVARSTAAELSGSLRPREARVLHAALAVGARARKRSLEPTKRALACAADVAAWASPKLAALEHEELWVLALDGRGGLRSARAIAVGGRHGLEASVADVLRHALRECASAIVAVHNHPSGDPTQSDEDRHFTRALADAAKIVGVPLLDHVVVARAGFRSVDA
jgi:DNA repair protein RadC